MTDEPNDPAGGFDGTVGSEHLGVRGWSVNAPTLQELIDRLAVILGEHMADGDELHVSYNAMQTGSHLIERPHLLRGTGAVDRERLRILRASRATRHAAARPGLTLGRNADVRIGSPARAAPRFVAPGTAWRAGSGRSPRRDAPLARPVLLQIDQGGSLGCTAGPATKQQQPGMLKDNDRARVV